MLLEIILITVIFILSLVIILEEHRIKDLRCRNDELEAIVNDYDERLVILRETCDKLNREAANFTDKNSVSIEETERMLRKVSNSYSVSNTSKLILMKLLFITLKNSEDIGIKDLRICTRDSISKNINIIRSKLEGDSSITDKEMSNALLALIFHAPRTKTY